MLTFLDAGGALDGIVGGGEGKGKGQFVLQDFSMNHS